MKQLTETVLQKMNLQRLKSHRTSVLAHISKEFYETVDGVRVLITDLNQEDFDLLIAYRNTVNKFYDSARTATKVN